MRAAYWRPRPCYQATNILGLSGVRSSFATSRQCRPSHPSVTTETNVVRRRKVLNRGASRQSGPMVESPMTCKKRHGAASLLAASTPAPYSPSVRAWRGCLEFDHVIALPTFGIARETPRALVSGIREVRRPIGAICAGVAVLPVVCPHSSRRHLRPGRPAIVRGRNGQPSSSRII